MDAQHPEAKVSGPGGLHINLSLELQKDSFACQNRMGLYPFATGMAIKQILLMSLSPVNCGNRSTMKTNPGYSWISLRDTKPQTADLKSQWSSTTTPKMSFMRCHGHKSASTFPLSSNQPHPITTPRSHSGITE